MPFCIKCGTEVPESVKFCTKCGSANPAGGAQATQEEYREAYLGLSAWEYYIKCIKNYANFEGRAGRKEYWKFFLVNFIITFVLSFLFHFFLAVLATKSYSFLMGYRYETSSNFSLYFLRGLEWLNKIYIVFMLSPYLAVSIRRLHDIGKSGLWWLLMLIPSLSPVIQIASLNRDNWLINSFPVDLLPLTGVIILFVWLCADSQPGKNIYGPNPKG